MSKKIIMDARFFILSIIIIGLILNSFNYVVRSQNPINIKQNDFYLKEYKEYAFINDNHYIKIGYDNNIVLSKSDITYRLVGSQSSLEDFNRCVDLEVVLNKNYSFDIIGIVKEYGVYNVDVIPVIKNDLELKQFAWFNSSFSHKILITINHSMIPSTRTNHPVCINFTSSCLNSYAQADGDDIFFVNGSENFKFNHEIEYYSSGSLVAWVNITSISSTVDTNLYCYFGNNGVPSQENVTGVWDSNYCQVLHFMDVEDSTSYNNDAQNYGATSHTGVIGGYYTFDGINDYWDIGTLSGEVSDFPYTVEQYSASIDTNQDNDAAQYSIFLRGYMYIVYRETAGGDVTGHSYYGTYREIDNTNNYYDTGENSVVDNVWNYTSYYCDDGSQQIMMDDTPDESGSVDNSGQAGTGYYLIGKHYSNEYWLYGSISEVRISNICRSDDYLKVCARNMMYPWDGGFFNISSCIAAPVVDEYILTSITPVNNSEVECLNLSQLCVKINSTIGSTSGWVNITLLNITYSNVSFTGNNTYCLNISDFNLSEGIQYKWFVNTSNSSDFTNKSFFYFNCSVGCGCYDEIQVLNYKLNYIINNMIKESDNIYIDLTANLYSIVLTLVLFLFFFSIGYKENKRSGGVFMLLSGFIFLSLEFLISSYLNTVYFLPLFTPIVIFIILLGIRKWLFMPEHEKTKSEGQ